MLAATSHSAKVSKLKQRLEQADEELGRVKNTTRGQARYAMTYSDLERYELFVLIMLLWCFT